VWKLGICTIEELKQQKQEVEKEASVHLYSEVEHLPDAELLAERILLRFMDQPGAYKRTYRNRFEAFDKPVIATLKQYCSHQPWVIHDHGVSDGRTACDWFEKLEKVNEDIQYFAFDFDPEVLVLRQGRRIAVLNESGTLLQIVWPPFVFNQMNLDSYRLYPINHLVRFCIAEPSAAALVRKLRKGQIIPTKLLLFSPRALALAHRDQRFQLGKQNILEPSRLKQPATILRAMNLLNPTHFTEAQIQTALQNIRSSLMEGGLFVVGSNQEEGTGVDGAIYQKKGDQFGLIWKCGNGPMIDITQS
jgi:hypothetical protein